MAAPSISPPRPVRQSGFTPGSCRSAGPTWPRRSPRWPGRRWPRSLPGRVAVLGPAVLLPELTRALVEAGLDPIDPRDPAGDGLAAGLVVLPADETNGLEFDSVVVVEPSLVAAVGDEPAGRGPPGGHDAGVAHPLRAFTRPTKRLTIVHAEPLPVDLH